MLGRRRDRDGQPFLDHELVQAAERLREDYELARMGTPSDFDWAQLLQAGAVSGGESILSTTGAKRSEALRARARVEAALRHLGPGLGDMALRCCCYLEGLETAEQQMGWSARSGKIVLRIALQRLCTHYAQHYGPHGPKIG